VRCLYGGGASTCPQERVEGSVKCRISNNILQYQQNKKEKIVYQVGGGVVVASRSTFRVLLSVWETRRT
jgi:hypothetical protein